MVSERAVEHFRTGELCPAPGLLLDISFRLWIVAPQGLDSPTTQLASHWSPEHHQALTGLQPQLPWVLMEPAGQIPPGAHLDQVHLACAHEVKREPVKRAVMPVAVGRAGGGTGMEGTLKGALLAHAETHAPDQLAGCPHPLNILDGDIAY